MSFFKAIEPALKHARFSVLLARAADGVITASFIPQTTDKSADSALRQPFALTGSVEELDALCETGIQQLAGTYASLAEQVEAAESVMRAAGKAKTDAAASALSAKSAKSKAATTMAVRTNPIAASTSDQGGDEGDDDEVSPNASAEGPGADAATTAPEQSSPFGELAL